MRMLLPQLAGLYLLARRRRCRSPPEHPTRTRRRRRRVRGSTHGPGLGLGEHPGRHAPFFRAVRRAIDYDLISVGERSEKSPETEVPLLVRRLVSLLSKRLAERPPEPLAREHHRALTRTENEETPLERRARQLARTHQQPVMPPS